MSFLLWQFVRAEGLLTGMGGSISSGRNNDELVDNLIEADYLKSPHLQQVFRAVDRGDYYSKGDRATAYRDSAYRHGNLHLSAPCIYSEVMEALKLKSGLSFLNLGSGSGYLSTLAGLVLGQYGINHGIELFSDVVDFAHHRLEEFLKSSEAVDAYEFCEPRFLMGNCLKIDCCNMQLYDRVYCGAACPEEHEDYMKHLIKIGGILVMPLNNKLLQITRTGEKSWMSCRVQSVSFAPLHCPEDKEVTGYLKLPDVTPPCLKEICRSKVRCILRKSIDDEHPELQKKRNVPVVTNRRHVRRIVIPIVDESESASGNSQNNSDDDDDDKSANIFIKYAVRPRIPSRATALLENFMRCRASFDEVAPGPSNYKGKGTAGGSKGSEGTSEEQKPSSTTESKEDEAAAAAATTKQEDSGISDSDMSVDEEKSKNSGSEIVLSDSSDPGSKELPDTKSAKAKSSSKKSRRKRQHSGSEQRTAANRKRVASYPRLKLRRTATVGYISSDEITSDSDKEGRPKAAEKPASPNEPNYTSLMVEKIKCLPLPRPLLDYVSYSRSGLLQ